METDTKRICKRRIQLDKGVRNMGETGAWIAAFVGLVAGIIGIIITVVNALRNVKSDTDKKSRESGEILTQIQYIRVSVDNIMHKLEDQIEQNTEFRIGIRNMESRQEDFVKHQEKIEDSLKKVENRVSILEEKLHSDNEGEGN